jgi:flagellar biosynthesis/type III secretory pathway protein FliH
MMSYSFEEVAIPSVDELVDPALAASGVADALDPTPPPELPELHGSRGGAGGVVPDVTEDEGKAALEEVRSAAHKLGLDEGRRVEMQRLETLVEAMSATLEELRLADGRREAEAVDRIAAIATAVAGHLIEREVHTSPEIISDLVRRAVTEFPVNESLVVHLNPSDLALLSSGLADGSGREQLTSGQAVRWVPDPAIRSGGCLVEGAERVVDARLSSILSRVFKALTDD